MALIRLTMCWAANWEVRPALDKVPKEVVTPLIVTEPRSVWVAVPSVPLALMPATKPLLPLSTAEPLLLFEALPMVMLLAAPVALLVKTTWSWKAPPSEAVSEPES
ncbi:hypothetical protein D3C72_2173690 [compost metagenome]